MKSQRSLLVLAAVVIAVCAAPAAGQIMPYSQDFEFLDAGSTGALAADGWLVFGNVFGADGTTYLYGYGPFPAPNDGSGFCQIAAEEGGIEQGLQQLVVYSDYNNTDHADGFIIESNVYREQTISVADVGTYWKFEFQAKRGNLEGVSTAKAFIKTLNPAAGYALTNLITVDMTAIPTTWGGYSVGIMIDASLVGQKLQIGFLNTATLYQGSAIFYDNLAFFQTDPSGVPGGSVFSGATLGQNYPNPFNPVTRIDFSLERSGPVAITVYDVAGRRVATLHQGELAAGDHHVTWNGRTESGAAAPAGLYNYVLRTADGQTARSMTLVK